MAEAVLQLQADDIPEGMQSLSLAPYKHAISSIASVIRCKYCWTDSTEHIGQCMGVKVMAQGRLYWNNCANQRQKAFIS